MNFNELFDIILDFIGTVLTESSLFGDLIKYIAEDGKVLQPSDIITLAPEDLFLQRWG